MRVLMLTPGLPQPTGSGAAIRNWYILHYLVEELGASVQLMTFGEATGLLAAEALPPSVSVTVVPVVSRPWRQRLTGLASSMRPDLADRLWTVEAHSRLVWLLLQDEFDLIHVGGLELGRYAVELIQSQTSVTRPAVVLDTYNAEYLLQRRALATDARHLMRWPQAAYSAVQWWRLRGFERTVIKLVDQVVCVSEADAEALRRLDRRLSPVIIPNGVDTSRYHLGDRLSPGLPRFDLVFSGTLDYRPNVDAALWFGRAVWPAVRVRFPELTFGLVGQRPVAAVRALGQRDGIIVTGPVPDDRPYLWGAGLYIVPMRYGGGIRLKLLNALAAGCPVITTSMGAEGIPVINGRDALVVDRPDQWVWAIERLLTNAVLRERLREHGRALVQRRFEWRSLVEGFGVVYQVALSRRDERGSMG